MWEEEFYVQNNYSNNLIIELLNKGDNFIRILYHKPADIPLLHCECNFQKHSLH